MYRSLDGILEPSLRSFLRYRERVLRARNQSGPVNAVSLEFPLTGKPVPVLGEFSVPDP
jgi:hypothetical protein